jgi:hypothetical protein
MPPGGNDGAGATARGAAYPARAGNREQVVDPRRPASGPEDRPGRSMLGAIGEGTYGEGHPPGGSRWLRHETPSEAVARERSQSGRVPPFEGGATNGTPYLYRDSDSPTHSPISGESSTRRAAKRSAPATHRPPAPGRGVSRRPGPSDLPRNSLVRLSWSSPGRNSTPDPILPARTKINECLPKNVKCDAGSAGGGWGMGARAAEAAGRLYSAASAARAFGRIKSLPDARRCATPAIPGSN